MQNTIPGRPLILRPVERTLPASLTGSSAAVRRVRAELEADGTGPLLILADDGLEPDVVARYLHVRTRQSQPFVAVDCARGDAEELEISLLGSRPRSGSGELESVAPAAALLAARRGTLFIDHLSDLPASVQRRLARILRDGEVRTNGRERVRIGARIVAAAPSSLASDAREGRVRADLLRRFAARQVAIPPLRMRVEDLPAIVRHVASDISAAARKPVPTFTQAALTVLSAFQWPGNITELRQALERILRDLTDPIVRQEDVLPTLPVEGIAAGLMTTAVSLREARRRFEREYIAAVLEQHQWRMSDAARTLGIERANLYRKTRQLGISREEMMTERPR